jgi:hypothetical protein
LRELELDGSRGKKNIVGMIRQRDIRETSNLQIDGYGGREERHCTTILELTGNKTIESLHLPGRCRGWYLPRPTRDSPSADTPIIPLPDLPPCLLSSVRSLYPSLPLPGRVPFASTLFGPPRITQRPRPLAAAAAVASDIGTRRPSGLPDRSMPHARSDPVSPLPVPPSTFCSYPIT